MSDAPHENTRSAPVSAGTPHKHERAFPNSCPYCGDDNLWPHQSSEDSPGFGEWECRSCLRAFKLTMLGQIARPGGTK